LALSRDQKSERVAEYIELLKQCRGMVLVDYQGLDVSEMEQIRRTLRPVDGVLQVVKNRLLVLALKEADMQIPDEWLTGPTAIGFCNDEVPPVAKALMDAKKETQKLDVKGGWMDAAVLSAEQMKEIADLPSREVLLAQVLGTFNAPARQTAGVIASGVRQIMNVLQAYVDKLGEAPQQAAEPA